MLSRPLSQCEFVSSLPFTSPLPTRHFNQHAHINGILRSTSMFSDSSESVSHLFAYGVPENGTRTKRVRHRVSIVSPMRWNTSNKCSLERKRSFINSTISYCSIKAILRSIGCDTTGGYEQCVERLLHSSWVPSRQHIESNERLRAKPVRKDDAVIRLECAESEYLHRFPINELKKWLKANDIKQEYGQSKWEVIRLIQRNFVAMTPSPMFKGKVRPKRPVHGLKTVSKTPKRVSSVSALSLRDILDLDSLHGVGGSEGDDEMGDVRMQLDFSW